MREKSSYKYINIRVDIVSYFNDNGLNKKLIPTLIEICNYVSLVNQEQQIILIKQIKEQMSKVLGIGIPEIDKHIKALKEAGILRHTDRSVYVVNSDFININFKEQ